MEIITELQATGTGSEGTFQTYVPPTDAEYFITAYGAQGGSDAAGNGFPGGKGARVTATFELQKNQTLKILVGQKGTDGDGIGGGGGASHVAIDNGDGTYTPLITAGGGGAGGYKEGYPGNAEFTNLADESESGGASGNDGGNSAGFVGNGTSGQINATAYSFVNGGTGSAGSGGGGNGGFGGGAGSESDSAGVASGDDGGSGGGYTGQAGLNNDVGPGGNSYSKVLDGSLITESGVREGDGLVIIEIKYNKKVRGTVFNAAGPAEKQVYVYSRNTGKLVGEGKSEATTGKFDIYINVNEQEKVMVVVVDKEENKNAIIYDQVTGEPL